MGLLLAACGSVEVGEGASTLEANFSGLQALADGYTYEGWVIVDGTPISAGRFNLSEMETSFSLTMDPEVLSAATTYVLTIEPVVGDDPGPSDTHVLAGDLANGSATLSVGHPAALGDDFMSASGDFILQTPTTNSIAADFDQGIWFFDPVNSVVTLNLPTLPAGWEYEGWVVGPNGPLSTGRFLDANGSDLDGAGPAAGSDGFPPAPGQDFITPAQSLIGFAAVITIEPQPDDSAAPYASMRPLVDMDITDVAPPNSQALANTADTLLPTGQININ